MAPPSNTTCHVVASGLGLGTRLDYLILLVASRVQLAGDIDTLLATCHRLTGARRDPATVPADQHVISASHTDRQSTLLLRTDASIHDPAWTVGRLGQIPPFDVVIFGSTVS